MVRTEPNKVASVSVRVYMSTELKERIDRLADTLGVDSRGLTRVLLAEAVLQKERGLAAAELMANTAVGHLLAGLPEQVGDGED